ncbi:Perchlorate reductase subunit gamma [Rhodoplanes serenus]|uniref:Perchlorate reductase subunit gamma n=1 Tax=Rhodoplanes serenus TaxID=200615 RepID=A0A447D207_9BRAD|nr:cytochrome c family protein [Rhodoplanes serenus]VCU11554.1 Perchlorate reductase subunit gamma [Rhodoplanes serenus]
MKSILPIGVALAILFVPGLARSQEFEGVSVCRKCHIDQAESWAQTSHAKAFESLKPKVKADAKQKGKLDPNKDYTADAACVGCHTTGFGKPGGFSAATPAAEHKNFAVVGCESCHGAGAKFRVEHGNAEERWKTGKGETARETLVKLGQNFDYKTACATCHLNYEGSGFTGAHPPFKVFTPALDPKYAFDYDKEVLRSGPGTGVHEHFKLKNVFIGEPVPAIRGQLQADAKDPD